MALRRCPLTYDTFLIVPLHPKKLLAILTPIFFLACHESYAIGPSASLECHSPAGASPIIKLTVQNGPSGYGDSVDFLEGKKSYKAVDDSDSIKGLSLYNHIDENSFILSYKPKNFNLELWALPETVIPVQKGFAGVYNFKAHLYFNEELTMDPGLDEERLGEPKLLECGLNFQNGSAG